MNDVVMLSTVPSKHEPTAVKVKAARGEGLSL